MGNGLSQGRAYQRADASHDDGGVVEEDEERGGTMAIMVDEERGEAGMMPRRGSGGRDEEDDEGGSSSSGGEESNDDDEEQGGGGGGGGSRPSSTSTTAAAAASSSATTLAGPTTINFAAFNSLVTSTMMSLQQHQHQEAEGEDAAAHQQADTWHTQRVVPHPPKVHHTKTIKCDINLSRETLRLVPLADTDAPPPHAKEQEEKEREGQGEKSRLLTAEHDVVEEGQQQQQQRQASSSSSGGLGASSSTKDYRVEFNFDANVECRVKVFFVAREKRDEDNHLIGYASTNEQTNPPPVHFPNPGLKQHYSQPLSHPFDVSLYSEEELDYDPHTQTYPVIITIEPIVMSSEQQERVSSQTTFATLLKCSDGSYVIKPIKVKIEFRGSSYIVYDIFGLDKDVHGDTGKECVVCMTDLRDTVVLPCRHMCLCRACAEVLRYQTTKCPICRSTFTSLLKVEASKDQRKSVDSDEEALKKKSKSKRKHKKDKERVKDDIASTSSEVAVEN